MTADPRAALDRFVAALEAHFDAIKTRRSDDDPRIDDAYDVLADAFAVYDDAIATKYSEVLPFSFVEEDEVEDDDDDDDDLDVGPDDDDDDIVTDDESLDYVEDDDVVARVDLDANVELAMDEADLADDE